MAQTDIKYGGGGNDGRDRGASRGSDAAVSIQGGQATIRDSSASHSMADGVRIGGGIGSVENNQLTDNAGFGLSFRNVVCSDWGMDNNVLLRNGRGDVQDGCN